MSAYRRRVSSFGAVVLLSSAFLSLSGVCLGAYPSLLVNESEYAELRARASQQPWASMKTRAISRSNNGYGDVSGSSYLNVQSCLAATALTYILDEPNQATYKARIYDGIVNKLGILNIGESYNWTGVVPAGNALFAAIHALDIVRNDLTSAERTACEGAIQDEVNLINTSGNWPLARKSLHGTWAMYNGETYNSDSYYNEIIDYTTPDGVFKAGSSYAYSRFNYLDRMHKNLFMDVLEHTGEDNRYYNSPQIRAFHEWLYTATASPSKRIIPFGDSIPSASFYPYSPLYRAAKFGGTVAGYASNLVGDVAYPPRDDLFSYVIPDADELFVNNGKVMPAAVPVKPKSKIYMEGGGWFWEDNTTEKSLMGAVWAVTGIGYMDAHCHKESNAIYMAAYGEHVLMNAGYAGYGYGMTGYSWTWINNNARSANTVLVNNLDHSSKSGGGVEEGFTSHGFDYACSNDGDALGNDTHLRSFIFVKPQDGKNGYFVLFDEVDADPGETVNVLLHPNTKATTGITTVFDKREYQATIDGLILDGNTDVKLSIFYGTTPTSVTKENGGIACGGNSTSPLNFESKYLNAQYDTDANGNVQVATVLFPHNDTHAKPTMHRISTDTVKGVFIDHGNGVGDRAMTSDGIADVSLCGNLQFRAKSVVYRRLSSTSDLCFYFARDSRKFLYTESDGGLIGFEADSDISIHLDIRPMEDWFYGDGKIHNGGNGTDVTFWHPSDLLDVFLNGDLLTPIASGDGWMTAYVPSGAHDLDIFWLEYPNPEPATLSLLAIGGFAMIRRRRK